MSSTSSSDCENSDYCQCGRSLDNNDSYDGYGRTIRSSRHVPFFSTMGHPLIYYAEVQRRPNRRQRGDQPRKENKNCFVKAFEWYTQERTVAPRKICPAAERCGFADWLDSKYIEYLRDSCMDQHVFQLTTQATNAIESCEPCSLAEESCTTTKRFARMRSPWRKRRRPCKDSGDVLEKGPNQSCEFIMQPKDLSRAASDCCYPTPNSGCNKSNATVASSNTPGTRGTGKSFSMTSVCREANQNPIDIIPCSVQEGSKTKPNPPPVKKPCCDCREKTLQVPSKPIKFKNREVSCQCSEEKVVSVNEQTQYECFCERNGLSSTKIARDVERNVQEPVTCCKCVDGHAPAPVKTGSGKLSKSDLKRKFVPSTQNTSQKTVIQVNVSCQCPEETVVTVDTPSQCQPDVGLGLCTCAARNLSAPNFYAPNVCTPNVGAPNVCAPNVGASNVYASNVGAPNVGAPNVSAPNVCAPNVVAPNAYPPNVAAPNVNAPNIGAPNVCCPNICNPPVRDVKETQQVCAPPSVASAAVTKDITVTVTKDITVTKYTRSLTLFANDGVQTSDHSICIERDGIQHYPFFMKIVCADRLNNVCF